MTRKLLLFVALVALVALMSTVDDRPVSVHAQVGQGRTFNCFVAASTATTLTAVGGDCVAPAKDQSIYVSQVSFSTNAAGITADSFNTLKYGTGGTCGTGTAVWWGAMTTAATQQNVQATFPTPIQIPAGNELCWINSTAGTKTLSIGGFIR